MSVVLSSRAAAGCGHSEYENMESDVPDASTDDEGLEKKRKDSQDRRNLSPSEQKHDGRKESIGKSSLKAAEHPTDDDDDVRSFEEEERRMAQELTVTEGERTDKTSGQTLSVSTTVFTFNMPLLSSFLSASLLSQTCTVTSRG